MIRHINSAPGSTNSGRVGLLDETGNGNQPRNVGQPSCLVLSRPNDLVGDWLSQATIRVEIIHRMEKKYLSDRIAISIKPNALCDAV